MAKSFSYISSYNSTIPKDWAVKYLGELGEFKSGCGFPESEQGGKDGVPFYKVSDMNLPLNETLMKTANNYLKEDQIKKLNLNAILDPAIIFAKVGAAIFLERKRIANNFFIDNNMMAFIPFENIEYLKYCFDNLILSKYAQTGAIPAYNATDLKTIKIILPPVPEQKAIAHILNLMDTAINKNNQLIAKKELQKKWLMQKLLTGKKRLKGFSGEWKEANLEKLFIEIRNTNDGEDGHSIMTISSKLGLISQEDKFDRVIAGESLKKYTQLKKGDFAYNKGNSKTYPMGCIYQLEEKMSALVPFVYICFSPTDLIDPNFYKHWFLAHGLDRQLKKLITSGARGDGLLNVNNHDFFKLKIPFPSKEEQTAIAQVLQAADIEIQLLKSKMEKLKEKKKWLMQVLLTGKVRVKVN